VYFIIALSSVTLALQMAACVIALAISQAPGWRRARIVAILAGTAGLYSFFDLLGFLYRLEETSIAWVTSSNLAVAAAHVATWVWFSFSDSEGRWSSVNPRLRWVAILHVLSAIVISATGNAVDTSRLDTVHVSWLDLTFQQPPLTALATASAAISVALLLVSWFEQLRQARRGVAGALWNAIGFFVFVTCAFEEILVAAGKVDFIYLAEVGYFALVTPLIAQFVRRFIGDANRLHGLTQTLEAEVHVATGERDAAREELAAQARFTALGRMASGVGHEINNPLQVLTLLLEELQETARKKGDTDALDALDQAVSASDRIGRIVSGMRAYARPSDEVPVRIAPQALVRAFVTALPAPASDAPEVVAEFEAAPDVIADRPRIEQALAHAFANAVLACAGTDGRPGGRAARITFRTRTASDGRAVIEVCDDGPGFRADLLPRLGEPFVTSHPAAGSAGMGIFIIRGVCEAHGGVLEIENAPRGGAVVRILLPAAD